MNIQRVYREIGIRILPKSGFRSKLLKDKYLQDVRIVGKNVSIEDDIKITSRVRLAIGNNVVFEGKHKINPLGGLVIGDKVLLKKGVNISTLENGKSGFEKYNPVIIGSGNKIMDHVHAGSILKNNDTTRGLLEYQGQIVFVVSTGRSGSHSISKLINEHDEANSYHDSFSPINRWSCDLLYAQYNNTEEIKTKLKAMYSSISMPESKVHCQSDHKLSAFIPLLAEMFPKAKFVWLIRNAKSFINSSYSRGWFANEEFDYKAHPREFFVKSTTPSDFNAAHRLNGSLLGKLSESAWKNMTAFERNCWYWTYWNTVIENGFKDLSENRKLFIRLEELSEKKSYLFDFMGLKTNSISISKTNSAKYRKISFSQWTKEMKVIFNINCGEAMLKWYGEN